jgi:AraC-like DNA-binding protein
MTQYHSELAEGIAKLAQSDGFSASALPGVRFMRAQRYVPRMPVSYEPSICIVAQGRKQGFLGPQSFVYDADNYLVLSVPMPFECETFAEPGTPMLGLSVGITPTLVGELLLEMAEKPPAAPARPDAIRAHPIEPALKEAATRLVRTLADPDDARVLGPQIVREIAYRVIRLEHGASLRALASPHSAFGQISRVLNLIHRDYAKAWDMPTLAAEAGMSVSTFHTHFKAVTHSSPLQYLKNIRLHKACFMMVHERATAGMASLRVGYESASQFSREFKRLFGDAPAAVAQHLRASLISLS